MENLFTISIDVQKQDAARLEQFEDQAISFRENKLTLQGFRSLNLVSSQINVTEEIETLEIVVAMREKLTDCARDLFVNAFSRNIADQFGVEALVYPGEKTTHSDNTYCI